MKQVSRFLLGCAAGAAAAVVVSRKSGREWRTVLADRLAPVLEPATHDSLPAGMPAVPVVVEPVVVAEAAAVAEARPEPEPTPEPGHMTYSEIADVFEEAKTVEAENELPRWQFVAEPTVVEPVLEPVEEPVASESEEVAASTEPDIAEREAAVGDLRARIEATKLAVQEVLQRPFAAETATTEPSRDETETETATTEPSSDEVETAESGLGEAVASSVVEASMPRPVGASDVFVVVDKETTEEMVADESTDDLDLEMPVTVVPVAELPSDEAESAASESFDQTEMRRRIEETRSRLKAKAFDAITSGQAALLSRDESAPPEPRALDSDLDNDVDEAVEKSLSPDDY